MRRFLIGLVVGLLVVVSIGMGITVAKWPQLRSELFRQQRGQHFAPR
jgi:hypothetical protein